MTKITRYEGYLTSVEVPEGYEKCNYCSGIGYPSKYDLGWSSLTHDESLAARERCFVCLGEGYVLSK